MEQFEASKKQASFSIDSILSQKMNNNNKKNNNFDITDAFRLQDRFTTLPPLIGRFDGRIDKRALMKCDCSKCEEEKGSSLYSRHVTPHSLDEEEGGKYFNISPSSRYSPNDDSTEDSQYFFKDDNIESDRYSKRRRTIFTSSQLERLEYEFQQQQYIVGQERRLLARQLGLNEIQVKVWFQNRRIKWRKFTSPGLSPMPELSL